MNHPRFRISLEDLAGSVLGWASSITAISLAEKVFHIIMDGLIIPFMAAVVGGVTMHYVRKFLNKRDEKKKENA